MLFSSSVFLFLFLPIVLGIHLVLPARLRNLFLLLASLFFYAWGEVFFTGIMIVSITLNYGFGLLIHRCQRKRPRQLAVFAAVAANLLVLGVFKYANFIVDNLNSILSRVGSDPVEIAAVHLPLGISFFTFQAMSYVIDVYRKSAPVQPSWLNVALYISLFPQLIAGPIVRYLDVAQQIVQRTLDPGLFASGVRRFTHGLAKKMLIANTLAGVVDPIFEIPSSDLTLSVAWLGIVCYALQIFFDFSGYSDMAIGLGRMFGFRFLENFNYPYVANSVQEFWHRWHISLSSWFKDYLYIPLGGNRVPPWRVYFNLFTVFFLCGLWHGASWNFAIWGMLHGAFLVFERVGLGSWIARSWRPVQHAYMLLVVLVGWVFFRADTLTQSLAYLGSMFGFSAGDVDRYYPELFLDPVRILALCLGVVLATPILRGLAQPQELVFERQNWVYGVGQVVSIAVLLLLCSFNLAAQTYNPFIYFRF